MKLLIVALLSLPMLVFADGGLPNQPYIYVEGKAEIEKPADMVRLSFNLVARAPDQAKANEEVQDKARKVLSLLQANKIADSDIIAQDLKSEPEFEREGESGDKRGKLIGYTVTRPFEAKIREVLTFPRLVDKLIALGGVEFSGVDGGLSKEEELKNDLWEKALVDARQRGEKTLKPMGMKIDSVFAASPVTFLDVSNRMLQMGGRTERVIVTGTNIRNEPAAPVYHVAPIGISQEVHVIYLISPAK